jgi:hypothetical protein
MNGLLWTDSHEYSVALGSDVTNMDSTTSWLEGSNVLYARGGLDPTRSYTITLIDQNTDLLNCTGKYNALCCIALDSITLLRPGSQDLYVPIHVPVLPC